MTATRLLDSSALIALLVDNHEHHGRVARWVGADRPIATCPIVEGALVRYLVRVGGGTSTATALLSGLYASPRCEFWPDDLSYASAGLTHVIGHRQVTDAYLASLAARRGAKLATLDQGLATIAPESVELID